MTAVQVDLILSGDMGGNVIRYFGIVTSFLCNCIAHFENVKHALKVHRAKGLGLSMLSVRVPVNRSEGAME